MANTNSNVTIDRIVYPATDTTGMSATKLFNKIEVASATDYNGLIAFISGVDKGFKRAAKLDEKADTVARIKRNGGELNRRLDYMIGYSGSTYNGSLFSIWSSYGKVATKKAPARPADYGIRISKPRLDAWRAISPAIELLTSNFKYEDSNEYRGSFYSFHDLMQFVVSLFSYIEVATKKTIEVDNIAGVNVG